MHTGRTRISLFTLAVIAAALASMGIGCDPGDAPGQSDGGVDAGACSDDDCGPAPGAPNYFCEDGSLAGPVCERAASTGECGWAIRACPPERQVCGTILGLGCPEDYFCDLAAGDGCHVSDAAGLCAYEYQNCLDIYLPVCGCDGQTYGNGCDATAHGVSIDYPGECEPEP